ncbi:MAG TPA: tetratricopeptide repeat protein, partial [Roseomonas sp.]|nr:tetratricopeptide repeat protein [Roseomonas sp.]
WSIDPADMPGDARAHRVFDPRRNAGMAVRPADLAPLPVIAFDPLLRQDAAQARRLAALPGVRAVPMRRGGHALVSVLVETGRLGQLLTAALDGNGPRAVAILGEARRASPTLREAVAAALDTRGHRNWAAALRRPPIAAAAAPAPAPASAADAGRRLAIQARALRVQRKHDAEAEALRRWIEADPRSVDARLQLAQCLQLLGRPEDATGALFAAMQAGLWDDRLHGVLVRVLRRVRRTDDALRAAAAAAAAAMPDDADAFAFLGEICLWAERKTEAEAAFLRALEQRPGHRAARHGLAVIEPLRPDGHAGPHLAALVETLANGPAPEAEWLRAIDRLWHAERTDAAIVAIGEARRRHPQARVLALRHGRILLGAGQEAAAVGCFEALVQAAPQEVLGWHGLLDALMLLRRHAEGRDAAVRAAALHPRDAVIATRHAAFLLALDDADAAKREARRAVELDPAADGGHLILIDALRRQFRNRDAIRVAREALDGPAAKANVALRLGRMLLDGDDPAGAAEAFARVTAMPDAPRQAWAAHAEALEAAGRLAEAEAVARAGLAARPEARELRAILGQLLLGRGEAEAARDALAAAIEEEAGSPAVSLAMADAWLRQGRRREALQLLTTAVAASPGHAEAEVRLGQLLVDEGRFDEAAALFTRICEAVPEMPAAWVGLSDAERLRKRVKPALEAYRRAVAVGADAQTVRALRFRLFGEYD